MKKEELKKPIYVAEVGTPLQKALVNNFEAQKQLEEVLDKYVQMTEERIVEKIRGEQFVNTAEAGQFELHADGYNQAIEDIIYLITNKSDINK